MQEYEMRISKTEYIPSLVAKGCYLNDFAAVRAAQRLCGDGQSAEVWRGDVCIFADRPGPGMNRDVGRSVA
jgi:hypothetical protein